MFAPDYAISHSITENYSTVLEYWKRKATDPHATLPPIEKGGSLYIRGEEYNYAQPYGFRLIRETDKESEAWIIACSGDNSLVIGNSNNPRVEEIKHPAFNDLHDAEITENGFLVVSSGLDAVFQVDREGYIKWSFYPAEHLDERYLYKPPTWLKLNQQDGVRLPVMDYSASEISTSGRNVHPNSVAVQRETKYPGDCERYVWLTLFKQGALARIDRQNDSMTIAHRGYCRPHGIREHKNYWSLADTAGRRVLLFDKESMVRGRPEIAHELRVETKWIQDANLSPDEKHLWVIDSDRSQLLIHEVNSQAVVDRLEIPKTKRPQHIAF